MNAETHLESSGPHAGLPAERIQDRWLRDLWDRLWVTYRQRVPYVVQYEELMAEHGVKFTNDHIAFRTFAHQHPATGFFPLARILDAAGYRPAGCYHFEDKHLTAVHFQHRLPGYPKIFISQLKTWELPEEAQAAIHRIVASHRPLPSDSLLARLYQLEESGPESYAELLDETVDWIERRPWDAPDRQDIELLNSVSQYAAWVALHGYNVNHFTAFINSQYGSPVDSIDKTVELLLEAGVPMKDRIEGEVGSILRQSATQAAVIDVEVRDGNQVTTMPWTYAYLELAERGETVDPTTGEKRLFEDFLGPQATHLFELTKKS